MGDGKVERLISEVLRRLDEDNAGLTLSLADDTSYVLTEEDLLRDFSIFSDEVFDADVESQPTSLIIKFRNGQTFRVTVKEVLE